ncbi:MAG: hypothetical protein JXA82_09010 [Sedimentisphaerales bacterium]|nr:hypothetical protein [Sedimentisphaerales bacterium]
MRKCRFHEIIVLASVIAFVLMVFLPAAGTARQHSKATLCLANLHILSRAWLAYAEENDSRLVNGHVPRDVQYANESHWLTTTSYSGPYKDNAWWVDPPHNENGIYTGDPPPCPLEDEENGICSGKLFPYVGSPETYHCPADSGYLAMSNSWGAGRSGKRSYSITGLMHGEQPNHPKCVDRIEQIVTPSQKFVLLENSDDRGWNMGSWIMNYGPPPSWIDPVAIFHDGCTTFAFADGHSEKYQWLDGDTIRRAGGTSTSPSLGRDLDWLAAHYIPGKVD